MAMSWTAYGSLAFVANNQPIVELPYDDVNPYGVDTLQELCLRPKAASDPVYVPYQQTLPVEDDGDRLRVCEINAERATEAGQFHAAQTWLLLLSQLVDLEDTSPTSEYSLKPSSHIEAPSQLSPKSVSASSLRGRDFFNSHTVPATVTSGSTRIDTRPIETSPLSYRTTADQTAKSTPSSSSPSPRSKPSPLSSRLSRPFSPNSSHDTSMSFSTKLITVSHRASTALPVLPPTRRLAMCRASISTPSTGGDLSVNEHPVACQHAHVGECALDDSESSSGSEGSAPAHNSLTHDMAGSQGGPQAWSSAVAKLTCDPAPPLSLLSKVPAPREDSPDERDEEGSVSGYDTDTSTSLARGRPRARPLHLNLPRASPLPNSQKRRIRNMSNSVRCQRPCYLLIVGQPWPILPAISYLAEITE